MECELELEAAEADVETAWTFRGGYCVTKLVMTSHARYCVSNFYW